MSRDERKAAFKKWLLKKYTKDGGGYAGNLDLKRQHEETKTEIYQPMREAIGLNSIYDIATIEQYEDLKFAIERGEEGIKKLKKSLEYKSSSDHLITAINLYGEFLAKDKDKPLTEEIVNPSGYYEGATKQLFVNSYERNRKARQECIDFHGCVCIVCGFDFAQTYGDMGQGFIHVHHIKPLSKINKQYIVDPETDLIPVCPNCHAMIHHKKDPPYTVKELQEFMKGKNNE